MRELKFHPYFALLLGTVLLISVAVIPAVVIPGFDLVHGLLLSACCAAIGEVQKRRSERKLHKKMLARCLYMLNEIPNTRFYELNDSTYSLAADIGRSLKREERLHAGMSR